MSIDTDGDRFEFRIGPAAPIQADEAARPGWRLSVEARRAGREFARVRMDVAASTDELNSTELRGVLSSAGPQTRIIAEKLHTLRTYAGGHSSRVKDFPDLLASDGLAASGALPKKVRHVWAVRATHPIPRGLLDPPAGWASRNAELTADLDLDPPILLDATAAPQAFCVRRPGGRHRPGERRLAARYTQPVVAASSQVVAVIRPRDMREDAGLSGDFDSTPLLP